MNKKRESLYKDKKKSCVNWVLIRDKTRWKVKKDVQT